MSNLNEILTEKFHFNDFRPGQAEAIEATLDGKDTLVMLPTGTGKSVCYQLPAYLMEGLTVIVSPLLSLMQDQVEAIKSRGEKRVASLTSEHHLTVQRRILKQLDQLYYLFLSPEMLGRSDVLKSLKKQTINLLAIDEAHCISEWGLDFRPDYLALGQMRQALGTPPTMALTATATDRTRQEIMSTLKMKPQNTEQVIYPLDRPEIKWQVLSCHRQEKDRCLLELVSEIKAPTVIYFMSKKECERVSHFLSEKTDYHCAFYHSDVLSEDKVKIQERFKQGNLDLICATSAFGMGIDKENIRAVIHYHLPASPEMYLQEIGRACRDGKLGLAVLIYSPGDEQFQSFIQQDSLPTSDLIDWVYQQPKNQVFADEEAVRLIAHYKQAGLSQERTKQLLENRRKIKKMQLAALVEFIHTPNCYRQTLLNYFGEEKKTSEQLCCGNCEENICQAVISQFDDYSTSRRAKESSGKWQEKFKELYRLNATVDSKI